MLCFHVELLGLLLIGVVINQKTKDCNRKYQEGIQEVMKKRQVGGGAGGGGGQSKLFGLRLELGSITFRRPFATLP